MALERTLLTLEADVSFNDDGVITGWAHSGGLTVGFVGSAYRGYQLLYRRQATPPELRVTARASTMPDR